MIETTEYKGKQEFNGWDDVPPYRRNVFQRVAAKTGGWVTPANVVTLGAQVPAVTGIVYAAEGRPALGAALFAGARVGDFIDGRIARRTGTQSSKGEALDVGFDKLQAIIGLSALMISGVYPTEAGVPKLATQLAITGYGIAAQRKKVELHPSREGKLNMGATTASMASFIAANSFELSHPAIADTLTYVGGYGLTAASLVLGTKTVIDYRSQVRNGIEAAAAAPQVVAGPDQQASA